MSSVTRYEPYFCGEGTADMSAHPLGDYVDYSDYKELEEKCESLENELDDLKSNIQDLYRCI